jgi:hypothetical protein
MAKKSYFTNKKKVKKYQFAGVNTEVDNTGYLNAMYNPNYYGEQNTDLSKQTAAARNQAIQQNLSLGSSSLQLAQDFKNTQETIKLDKANAEKEMQALNAQAAEDSRKQFESTITGEVSKFVSADNPFLKEGIKGIVAKQAAKKAASNTANLLNEAGNVTLASAKAAAPTTAAATQGASAGANATSAGTTAATSTANLAASGIAAAAAIGGEAWKYYSSDKDPGTYTKKEKAGTIGGTILSRTGTGAGLGMTAGSLIAPGVGTVVGGIIGGTIGLTAGTIEGLAKNKKYKRQAEDIQNYNKEQNRLYQEALTKNQMARQNYQKYADYMSNKYADAIARSTNMDRYNYLMGKTTSEFQGNMAQTGGVKKYLSGGANAKRIPGGMVVPVPGANNAVEYIGNKHSEKKIDNVSGIRPDSKTEVEDGEIKAPVEQANGYPAEYYFSSYLKYGGIPIATHFKNIIKNGGTQEDIQDLAKIQEAIANKKGEEDRSPNTIAKYGGIHKYKTAGMEETDKNTNGKYEPMYTPEQIKAARTLFGIGAGAQLVSPILSYFKKPKLASAPDAVTAKLISKNTLSAPRMITPGRVEAPRLGRVQADTQGINERLLALNAALNTGDPSSKIALIASGVKASADERKAIQQAMETNIKLAGEEGRLGLEASARNQSASLEAQSANQRALMEYQKAQSDIDRANQEAELRAMLANQENRRMYELTNIDARNKKDLRDIQATSALGTNIAGIIGDVFSYGSEDAKARAASGDTGVYRANFLPLLFGEKEPKKQTGGVKSYTSRLGDLKYKRPLKVK